MRGRRRCSGGWVATCQVIRSGAEGTVNECAHGRGMRHSRYRGRGEVHLQHVLTAIAINVERLSGLSPTEEALPPRRPPSRTTSTSAGSPGPNPGAPWAPDL
ncbi:transposase [Streptomyces sp. NPDC006446]|uniref:transposase n=1 Tax=Streptomyces sp. NPDC006446 TaxID=3154301 RepID=UPI0033BF5E6B